jgi:hypothetical protein
MVTKIRDKLTVENPAFLCEWDYNKNGELRPEDFTGGSNVKVWWKCSIGHSWITAIKCRSNGTNCPFCAGKKVWAGYNDLATINPVLAAEWDYEKNGRLRPENFTGSSNKSTWLKCKLDHSWFAMIKNRTIGQGCPYCSGKRVLIGFNNLPTISPKFVTEWDYGKNDGLNSEQFTKGSNRKVWWKCVAKGHCVEVCYYPPPAWKRLSILRRKSCACR